MEEKIALLLRGIVWHPCYKHWTYKYCEIDYKINVDNVKNQLIDPLISKYGNVDIYISTYINSKYSEVDIKNDFDYKGISMVCYDNHKQTDCMRIGLNMILDTQIKYKYVLATRFDLYFKINIIDLDYNFNSINFIWRELNDETQVGDCLHLIPYNYISYFITLLKDSKVSMHDICKHVDNPHFLFKDRFWSNSDDLCNPLYIIRRKYLKKNIIFK